MFWVGLDLVLVLGFFFRIKEWNGKGITVVSVYLSHSLIGQSPLLFVTETFLSIFLSYLGLGTYERERMGTDRISNEPHVRINTTTSKPYSSS